MARGRWRALYFEMDTPSSQCPTTRALNSERTPDSCIVPAYFPRLAPFAQPAEQKAGHLPSRRQATKMANAAQRTSDSSRSRTNSMAVEIK